MSTRVLTKLFFKFPFYEGESKFSILRNHTIHIIWTISYDTYTSTQQQVGRKYKPDATAGAFGLIGYQLTTNAASRAVANRREDDDQNILDSEHYLLGQKVRPSI